MSEKKKNQARSADGIFKMKSFYDEGRSFSEVGDRFGISPSRVEQIFRQNNIKTRKKTVSKKFLKAMRNRRIILEKEVLAKLYLVEKLSIHKVAEKLKTSDHVVRSNLKAYGIPIRPLERYTTSQLTPELLQSLYIDKNLTAPEIAERLGYSALTIGKKLSKFGIKKRSGTSGIRKLSKLTAQQSLNGQSAHRCSVDGAAAKDKSPAADELLTVAEIVEKYKIHPVNLRKLIREGFFPNAFRQILGKVRRWMVPVGDLETFTPRKRGGRRIVEPTAATIRSRAVYARAAIKSSHGYGKAEINEMIALEKKGWTKAEIAARFRLNEETVSDILNQSALYPPRAKKPPRVKKELKRLPEQLLTELYANNLFSTKYILEKLNTNYSSLYISLRHYGIPLRDERRRLTAQEKAQILHHLFSKEKLAPDVIADRMGLTMAYVKRKINELKLRSDFE